VVAVHGLDTDLEVDGRWRRVSVGGEGAGRQGAWESSRGVCGMDSVYVVQV
jgi:hypothetical protein